VTTRRDDRVLPEMRALGERAAGFDRDLIAFLEA
jgi:hypothetical protein